MIIEMTYSDGRTLIYKDITEIKIEEESATEDDKNIFINGDSLAEVLKEISVDTLNDAIVMLTNQIAKERSK